MPDMAFLLPSTGSMMTLGPPPRRSFVPHSSETMLKGSPDFSRQPMMMSSARLSIGKVLSPEAPVPSAAVEKGRRRMPPSSMKRRFPMDLSLSIVMTRTEYHYTQGLSALTMPASADIINS